MKRFPYCLHHSTVRVVAFSAVALATTQLHVIRKADNSLCVWLCTGTACGVCNAITGGFSTQPTVTWDESLQKFVLMGVGNNGISVWRRLFNADGTAAGDWAKVMDNVTPGPISPVGSGAVVLKPFVVTALNDAVQPFTGGGVCQNFETVTVTAPAAGTVVVDADVIVMALHDNNSFSDAVRFFIGTSATDCDRTGSCICGLDCNPPPCRPITCPCPNQTTAEFEVDNAEQVGNLFTGTLHLQRRFSIPANTATTYYLNGIWLSNWGSLDAVIRAGMKAVWYP
ncbi:MAG: hypothetical protein MZV65_00240 [Chromatiales bacterium]|nr:hypothetical protein [Chromatiales bacterium]